ncbi:MAG: alpha-hydroxy acid oxidase [Neisseria sp.]|nr:alpha-hydroxy acid oxidase [Neisseria sp.]
MSFDLSKITCVEDLRRVYHRRVPKMFVDYCESGSWTESTLHANRAAFAALKFRQKVLVDLSRRSLKTTMLGEEVNLPLALAPVGMSGMQHADGEILAARAAERFGVPYILSTVSICSIEEVAAHTTRPFWFQLYMMRDRDFMRDLIARAKAAGCSALVLTADLQVLGQRNRDIKNGLSTPPKPTLKNLLNLSTKASWGLAMLNTQRRTFGNIVGHAQNVSDPTSLSAWTAEQFDLQLSWDDVAWVKNEWGGKLVIKGIMDADDARRAVAAGADALIVSNHGGRQLDGAPASLEVLPEIVAAVGGQIEVWLDGGIRSGQDLLKAVALGAHAVLIGRAYVYGLGAYGEAGVRRVLEMIRNEADISMALCGHTDIRQVGRDILR